MSEQKQNDNPTPEGIKDFRQPMIASLGIIMGFLLNFLATWAVESDTAAVQGLADAVVAITLMLALGLMLYVLYGLLEPNAKRPYRRIFHVYLASLATAFTGVMLALFL